MSTEQPFDQPTPPAVKPKRRGSPATAKTRAIWDHGNLIGRAKQAELMLARVLDTCTTTPAARQAALDLADGVYRLRLELKTMLLENVPQ